MIRWILKKFGYIKFDWGHSCGRYWLELDEHEFCQGGLDSPIPNEYIVMIVSKLRGY